MNSNEFIENVGNIENLYSKSFQPLTKILHPLFIKDNIIDKISAISMPINLFLVKSYYSYAENIMKLNNDDYKITEEDLSLIFSNISIFKNNNLNVSPEVLSYRILQEFIKQVRQIGYELSDGDGFNDLLIDSLFQMILFEINFKNLLIIELVENIQNLSSNGSNDILIKRFINKFFDDKQNELNTLNK